ncbi:hypothetical protein [Flavobacterium johnsoniae]|uniref:hypothetical protein n=1 Tax=Flavobacterium johnsoniae TaxID=986 RepID=UPI003D980F7B
MQSQELLQNLLSQKYRKPIVTKGDYKTRKSAALLDTDNGTFFNVSADFLFYFKDKNDNVWLTIPKELIINGKIYYPKPGDSFTNLGTTHYFTTKEAVIEMAYSYFKQFENPHYGIERVTNGMYFFENSGGKTDKYFVVFQKFKSSNHPQIEAYISSN